MAAANPNIRIVFDNAADRATIAASSQAGQLVAANLKTNLKSHVWRGLTPRESLVVSWDRPEPVGVVVLAFNNMTAQGTIRLKGYTRNSDLFPEVDIGPVLAAPPAGLGQFGWGMPLGSNFYERGGASLFAYGYGSYAVLWVPQGRALRKLEIVLTDLDNPDGYIEAGRLIVGPYWSPEYNFDFNHQIVPVDSTQNRRTEAGDLRGELSPKWRKINFSLSNMDAEDRAAMLRILRRHGTSRPVFISLFPENADPVLEQAYSLWGKFVEDVPVSQPNFDVYAASASVEEM